MQQALLRRFPVQLELLYHEGQTIPMAAVFFVMLIPAAGAQQSSPIQITVQAVDPTGMAIPSAHVRVDPSPGAMKSDVTTDGRGEAVLELPAGSYTLWIDAPGFERWSRRIEVRGAESQTLRAKLEVGQVSGPPLVAWQPEIPLESPQPIFLALQPAGTLSPLLSSRAKKRQ